MSPIDEVRPAQAGNWVRRVEEKRKRREPPPEQHRALPRGPARGPGNGQEGEPPDHIVDELA